MFTLHAAVQEHGLSLTRLEVPFFLGGVGSSGRRAQRRCGGRLGVEHVQQELLVVRKRAALTLHRRCCCCTQTHVNTSLQLKHRRTQSWAEFILMNRKEFIIIKLYYQLSIILSNILSNYHFYTLSFQSNCLWSVDAGLTQRRGLWVMSLLPGSFWESESPFGSELLDAGTTETDQCWTFPHRLLCTDMCPACFYSERWIYCEATSLQLGRPCPPPLLAVGPGLWGHQTRTAWTGWGVYSFSSSPTVWLPGYEGNYLYGRGVKRGEQVRQSQHGRHTERVHTSLSRKRNKFRHLALN